MLLRWKNIHLLIWLQSMKNDILEINHLSFSFNMPHQAREREKRKEVLTLTSALLQGGALGVLSRLGLPVFGQLSQRVRLSLLVLFALAAVMAALRFPVRSLPPLLLLSAWRGGRLLSVVVEDILLLLEEREVFILGWWNLNSTFVALKKIKNTKI